MKSVTMGLANVDKIFVGIMEILHHKLNKPYIVRILLLVAPSLLRARHDCVRLQHF